MSCREKFHYLWSDPLPVHGQTSLQQLHDQLAHELVGVVVCPEQQQRLLELLDVEFKEMEGFPESETVSRGL